MTVRGDQTRAALIRATTCVVTKYGYHQATTRAIAAEAGVSEATIYRHFPDKRALFFAAVLDGHQEMLAWMSELPGLAGTGSLADTLTECLTRLAELRHTLVPLELALMIDDNQDHPDKAPSALLDAMDGPPRLLAEYLAGEQHGGRVNPHLDPAHMAVVLLAALFGLAAVPTGPGVQLPALIAETVNVFIQGIGQTPTPAPRFT
ncbi:MAG: TetR/AcrR family transcriptional regulator [Dermatophilaceae bacterium]